MHAQQNSRPVMKAIISDFSLMLSLIQPFFFFSFFYKGDGLSHCYSPHSWQHFIEYDCVGQ